MKIEDTISSLRDRIRPPRDGKLGNVLKVAAGTAAAVWVVLQLRRELYGPGGSRMSPYDSRVDKKRRREKETQSDFVDAEGGNKSAQSGSADTESAEEAQYD